MRSFLKYIMVIALLAGYSPPVFAAMKANEAAPVLQLPLFDGTSFNLDAQKGKIVIVNFWASWCAPCQAELPLLAAFYKQHRKEGVEVIAVSLDRHGERDDAQHILQKFDLPGGLFEDAEKNTFDDPETLPMTYIVGRKGIIRSVQTEPFTQNSLSRLVLPMLQ